jgi:hypothetical protein
MQKTNFLPSFDIQTKSAINIEQKIIDIKKEQEGIYSQKLQTTKELIEKELLKKQQDEIKAFKEKLLKESHEKYLKEIETIKTQFDKTQIQYTENYTKIFQYFLNYYLVKLNKHVITHEISDIIKKTFKECQINTFEICANQETLKDIKNNISTDEKITFTTNDSLENYMIVVNYQDKCSFINLTDIIKKTQDNFNKVLLF